MFISTKDVGKFEREDITELYKNKEGKFCFPESNNDLKLYKLFNRID